MAKSKKFKPILKISEIRCGVTYIRIVVNDTGVVFCSIYTPTCDPYVKPTSYRKNSKPLKVDYISINSAGDVYHSKDNFISDTIGIYDSKRQTSLFHDHSAGTKIVLHCKGLFKFSNKLLEKFKSFKGDPIQVLEFLNPERFLNASERLVILSTYNGKRSGKKYYLESRNTY